MGGQAPQPRPFSTTLGEMAKIQQTVMQMGEMDRKRRAEADIRQIMETSNGDWDLAVAEISKRYPQEGLAIGQKVSEARVAGLRALEQKHKTEKELINLALPALEAIESQSGYDSWKGWVSQMSPEFGKQLPGEWTPQVRDSLRRVGLSAKDVMEQRDKALEAARDGKWDIALGRWLPTTGTQEEWDGVLESARMMGAPRSYLDTVPRQRSPEAINAVSARAISPDRAADDKRQADAAAETVRANKAREAEVQRHNEELERTAKQRADAYAKGQGALAASRTATVPGGGNSGVDARAIATRKERGARWKADQIAAVEKALRDGVMDKEDAPSEYFRIENGYRDIIAAPRVSADEVAKMYGLDKKVEPAANAPAPPPSQTGARDVNLPREPRRPLYTNNPQDMEAARAAARAHLAENGYDSSDASVQKFLDNPRNQKALNIVHR
jgi:hypothetical protein